MLVDRHLNKVYDDDDDDDDDEWSFQDIHVRLDSPSASFCVIVLLGVSRLYLPYCTYSFRQLALILKHFAYNDTNRIGSQFPLLQRCQFNTSLSTVNMDKLQCNSLNDIPQPTLKKLFADIIILYIQLKRFYLNP